MIDYSCGFLWDPFFVGKSGNQRAINALTIDSTSIHSVRNVRWQYELWVKIVYSNKTGSVVGVIL